MSSHDRIAVVDFGGQYAHLIATKVRHMSVLAEIREPDDPIEAFAGYKGVILSGSPALASDGDLPFTKEILDLEYPQLGFCFGHQEIAKRGGGSVEHVQREYGPARLSVVKPSAIFEGVPTESTVWMSHGDSVVSLGEGFVEIGTSLAPGDEAPHRNAAIAHEKKRRYGFQYHPEVDDSEYGEMMLRNFVIGVCGCRPTWTMAGYVDHQIEEIRRAAGENGVFLLASGGVDSTVCAALFARALGADKLHLLHVDNGLMRKGESQKVMESLEKLGASKNLHFIDASEDFLVRLDGVVDPEAKRRAIGDTYVAVFEREAERLGLRSMLLGQGTIYPDTVETGGTKRADVIKTHHNRVPIIEQMIREGRVIEPLRELYKPEVRDLGARLGISEDMLWRHPFPGPGLGIRLLCSDGSLPPGWEHAESGNAKIREILGDSGFAGRLLPLRSVGVKADLRSYEMPAWLSGACDFPRAVELSTRLYKSVPGVNRAVLDIGRRPLGDVRPAKAHITRQRLDLLREADAIVMSALARHGLGRVVWQCPTVAIPLAQGSATGELIVVRPIHSERAMTAKAAELPRAVIDDIQSILDLPGVVGLGLDLTTKPPGTIEWE
jgi:GMP synthase (glutamine-hydrolysing)